MERKLGAKSCLMFRSGSFFVILTCCLLNAHVAVGEQTYYISGEFELVKHTFSRLRFVGIYSILKLQDYCPTLDGCHYNDVDKELYVKHCLKSTCPLRNYICVNTPDAPVQFCAALENAQKRERYVVVHDAVRGTVSVYTVPCDDGHIQNHLNKGVEKCIDDQSAHIYQSSTSTSPGLGYCAAENGFCNTRFKTVFEYGSDDDQCNATGGHCLSLGKDLLPNCSCADPCPEGATRSPSEEFRCILQLSANNDLSLTHEKRTEDNYPLETNKTDNDGHTVDVKTQDNEVITEHGEDSKVPGKGDNSTKESGQKGTVLAVVIASLAVAIVFLAGVIVALLVHHWKSNRENTPVNRTWKKVITKYITNVYNDFSCKSVVDVHSESDGDGERGQQTGEVLQDSTEMERLKEHQMRADPDGQSISSETEPLKPCTPSV